MDNVESLIEELENVLDDSKSKPFSNKVVIDRDTLDDLIRDIKAKLPNELKQSKWIIEERNKILIDAQREAEEIIQSAEDRLSELIEQDEITLRAYERAEAIVESGKLVSKELHLGANEYAIEILSETEEKIKEMFQIIQNENKKLEDFFMETLDIIYENKRELLQ